MRKAALILLIATTMLTLNAASIRVLSRGDAVLTSNDVRFSFSHNPAFLSARDYSVNIPINARIYNISGLLENDLVKDISDLSSMDRERMISSLLDLLREFNGTMPLLGLDEDISFTVGGFGLDVSLKESVITSGGSVGTTLSAAVEGAVTAGFGFKYERDDYLISLGITPKLSYSIYTSPVGIDTAVGILLDNSLFDNVEIYQGIGFSADIGAYAAFPYNFKAALVLRDIGSRIMVSDTGGRTELENRPLRLDAALGWSGQWGIISLDLEMGLRGLDNIKDDVDLMKSFNAGMRLGITDFIAINAGINGGYPSCGLELNIFFIDLMVAYYYQDYGVTYGLSPRDVVAFELALSF